MAQEAPTEASEFAPERWTVAVGFDGVLHSYTSGWQGGLVIPDPPVPGAIEWLNEVSAVYDVAVLTPRARYLGAAQAIGDWLAAHGYAGDVLVAERLQAVVFVDRQAYRFRGKFPTVQQIRYGLRPWRPDAPTARSGVSSLRARLEKLGRTLNEVNAKQHRLRVERRRLYEELIEETLRSAGYDEDVRAEWIRQSEGEPFEKRLEAARALRDAQ